MLEVVVVGGGIAGAAVALELADRGVPVTVVDAERPGAAATGASAGMLAPQYESGGDGPLFRLLVEARRTFGDWAERVERLSERTLAVRRDGMLVANATPAEHEDGGRLVAWQRDAGLAAELVDPGEAERFQPGVAPDAVSFVWLPDEAQVDTQALALALPEALAAAGVRVLAGRRVAAVVAEGGRVEGVRLADGRVLEADAVVVAAGAWSGTIGGLSLPVGVGPVRGHLLRFPAPKPPLRRMVAAHAGRYLVPRGDGTVLAGSTMDRVGFDRSLSGSGLALVRRTAETLFPALGRVEPVERWADLRPISDDGLPLLGPDPSVPGIHYATGYGRNGILLGPLAGRAVAELLVDGASDVGWRPFGAER